MKNDIAKMEYPRNCNCYIGECYKSIINGKVELYQKEEFLEVLKNAAVEHFNEAIATKNDEELINLR